jgi:hypothetical protein
MLFPCRETCILLSTTDDLHILALLEVDSVFVADHDNWRLPRMNHHTRQS